MENKDIMKNMISQITTTTRFFFKEFAVTVYHLRVFKDLKQISCSGSYYITYLRYVLYRFLIYKCSSIKYAYICGRCYINGLIGGLILL